MPDHAKVAQQWIESAAISGNISHSASRLEDGRNQLRRSGNMPQTGEWIGNKNHNANKESGREHSNGDEVGH